MALAYLIAEDSGTLRKFVVLTLLSGVVATVLSLIMFYIGSDYLSASGTKTILTDQSLAGYIGIIIGAGVALGGSLVTIMLAERTVDSANRQLELTDRANGIAERQTPEAQLASEAAANYERLKGMLLTVPSLMRRAQRDGCFALEGDQGILADILGLISTSTRVLLESSVPATITNLACTLETRARTSQSADAYNIQRQRYFEYAFSSISYDLVYIGRALGGPVKPHEDAVLLQLHLQRLLHAIFSIVREIDRLLKEAEKEAGRLRDLGTSSNSDASTPGQMYKKGSGQLSQFEISFIERVMPVVELNTALWLPDDFHKLATMALKRLRNENYSSAKLLSSETGIDPSGGLILALHDSGHAQAMLKIEGSAALHGAPQIVRLDEGSWANDAEKVKKNHVPIFWITEKAGDRLIQLQSYLEEKRGHWDKQIIVIEQIDLATDSSNTPSNKYLTIFDQIICWRALNLVHVLLASMDEDTDFSDGYVFPAHEQANEVISRARLPFQHEGAEHRLQLPGGQWMTDFVVPMFERAAAAVGSVPENHPGFGLSWALQCNTLLDALRTHTPEYPDRIDEDRVPETAHPLHFVSDCYAEFRSTLEELARAPLVERPWYAFAGVNQPSLRDFSFHNTSFYGIAYIGSEFTLGASPLTDLLAYSRPVYRLF